MPRGPRASQLQVTVRGCQSVLKGLDASDPLWLSREMVTDAEAAEALKKVLPNKPAVRKRTLKVDNQMRLVIAVFEQQHRALLLLDKGAELDISSMNESVRALLSCLVEMSDGS